MITVLPIQRFQMLVERFAFGLQFGHELVEVFLLFRGEERVRAHAAFSETTHELVLGDAPRAFVASERDRDYARIGTG